MEALPAFVAGVVLGLVLAGAFAAIRRGAVTDLGGLSGQSHASRPTSAVSWSSQDSGDPLDPLALPAPAFEQTSRGFRSTRTVVRRVGARLEPNGQLTIEVDGRTYHRLEDVPDAAAREQVRAVLASVPAQVRDPDQRARVEAELHDAGIDEATADAPSEDVAPAGPPASGQLTPGSEGATPPRA